MFIGFIVFCAVAAFFVWIGLCARKSAEPVGFFTGVKPPAVKDITAYNRAVSRLWLFVAAATALCGVPFLFAGQNSPAFIFIIFAMLILMIGMILAYLRIEVKYK